jgi:hypothetical protein
LENRIFALFESKCLNFINSFFDFESSLKTCRHFVFQSCRKCFWKNVHFKNFQRFEGVCLTGEQPVPQDENRTKDLKLNDQLPSP